MYQYRIGRTLTSLEGRVLVFNPGMTALRKELTE